MRPVTRRSTTTKVERHVDAIVDGIEQRDGLLIYTFLSVEGDKYTIQESDMQQRLPYLRGDRVTLDITVLS